MNSTTIFPATNYPQNVTGRKSGAARLCAAPLNYCPIRAARMKARSFALTASSLFTPSGMSRVISAHSSGVKLKSTATCPESEPGAISARIAACFFSGIGRGLRCSNQPSTVTGLTNSFSARSCLLVPVSRSHFLNCSRSMRIY